MATADAPTIRDAPERSRFEALDGDAVVDGNVVSGRAWPDHPTWMRAFMTILKEHAPA